MCGRVNSAKKIIIPAWLESTLPLRCVFLVSPGMGDRRAGTCDGLATVTLTHVPRIQNWTPSQKTSTMPPCHGGPCKAIVLAYLIGSTHGRAMPFVFLLSPPPSSSWFSFPFSFFTKTCVSDRCWEFGGDPLRRGCARCWRWKQNSKLILSLQVLFLSIQL